MVSKNQKHDAGDDECPACRLRRGLATGLTADPMYQQEVLDALLDAVEAVRALQIVDDDEETEFATVAAHELVVAVHILHRIAVGGDEEGGE